MSDIVERLRAPSNLMTTWTHVALHGEAAAEIERLRGALSDAVALIERLIDTRRCGVSDLRTLNAARAALEAKP